jgi:hypothetical protein
MTRRHGRLTPEGATRAQERRRDRWLRAMGLGLVCFTLGPPFVIVLVGALRGLR